MLKSDALSRLSVSSSSAMTFLCAHGISDSFAEVLPQLLLRYPNSVSENDPNDITALCDN